MKNKKRTVMIVSWVAVGLCMTTIFMFSHQNGENSTGSSSSIVLFINSIIGVYIPEIIIRKSAHMLEYFILTMLVFNAMIRTTNKISPFYSGVIAALFAASDEIHQAFVPGRAAMFTDWLIDCIGVTVALVLCFIIMRVRIARNKR